MSHTLKSGDNKLMDVEWNIGVTAASNNDDVTGRTFLHFKMSLEKDAGTKTDSIHLELSPNDFYKLMHEMERAKNNLEALMGSS